MGDASGALKASTSETSPAESSKAVEPVPKTEKQWLDDTIVRIWCLDAMRSLG